MRSGGGNDFETADAVMTAGGGHFGRSLSLRKPQDKIIASAAMTATGGAKATPTAKAASAPDTVVVIERRSLVRDCLRHCLERNPNWSVIACAGVDDWLEVSDSTPASLVVYSSAGNQKASEFERVQTLSGGTRAPIMLMSDIDDPDHIIEVLAKGARGFLPTDISLDIAVEAMHFVLAGGVFVPASSLLAARRQTEPTITRPTEQRQFTSRQIAVIKALRQGKANKIIAYELNMCESTVKVHVRNIMKKLKAKNRTQVAFIANEMFNEPDARA